MNLDALNTNDTNDTTENEPNLIYDVAIKSTAANESAADDTLLNKSLFKET